MLKSDSLTLAVPAPQAAPAKALALWSHAMRIPLFWIGLALLALPLLVAIFGPWLVLYPVNDFVDGPFAVASELARFGTDNLGRDVLSRFLAGGTTLLWLSVLATVLGVALGGFLGTWLALGRGIAISLSLRVVDVLLAFPSIVLALMCLSLLGPQSWLIVLVVALGHFPRTLRVIRSAALSVVERDFVSYLRTLGFSRARIVLGTLLPNLAVPLMVELGIRFSWSIGLVASLSFLGLGVQPPTPDWGKMINENRQAFVIQPWGVLLPLFAIALLATGCNLLTDALGRAASHPQESPRHG